MNKVVNKDYQCYTLLGFGKSTIAALDFLLEKFPQAQLRVSELKSATNFDTSIIEAFRKRGVEFEFGLQSIEFISFANTTQALFVMVSPGIPPRSPIILQLQELCKASNIDYGTDLDIFAWFNNHNYIGITGTNGKTTTTSFVAHVLGNEAVGNIGKPFLEYESAGQGHNNFFAAEISSFQLFYSTQFVKPLYRPSIAVHLNLTDDHLDWHKDLEEYKLSKEKLFQIPELADKHSYTWVLNNDDKHCRVLGVNTLAELEANGQANLDVAFFSTQKSLVELNQYARSSAFCENDTLYLAKFLPDAFDDNYGGIVEVNTSGNYYVKIPLMKTVDLNLVGEHNYANLLAGILAADAAGIALEQIIKALKTFKAVPHRLEFIGELAGHKFYNDSKATNPDSAIKALEAFEQSIVICGGKNKNLDLTDFIKRLAAKAYAVVLIGELREEIAQGLQKLGFKNFSLSDDMDDAVKQSLNWSKANQLPIVLAPASSSFDMFKNYEDRGEKFKESFSKLVVSLK